VKKVGIIAALIVILFAVVPAGGGSTGTPETQDHAEAGATGHDDPVMPILIALAVILLGAKLGGEIFERMSLPGVLGELITGVVLGNIDTFLGTGLFTILREGDTYEMLRIFASLGAIFLLFDVGLETTVVQMMKVGPSAALVGTAGVVVPWLLGYGVGVALLPEASFQAHLFMGAILTATSVGITARVYKDMGKLDTGEARVILGAAVIDDILGLIILSVVSGIVIHGAVGILDVGQIVLLSTIFLVGAIIVGEKAAVLISKYFGMFRVQGMKLMTALMFCFGMAYISGKIGLAPIIGAFAAGLILEEQHFASFTGEKTLHDLLKPFSSFFVPVFFVLMGVEVRLEAFADISVLGLAAGITGAAILGKQVCGLAVLDKGLDRWSVGIGMIPRGEVGLIFASIGKALGVVDDSLYAACVIMVIVTTFIAPVALQIRMKRQAARAGGGPPTLAAGD
jgi:Kef-type K+ transport system membrane component KefB